MRAGSKRRPMGYKISALKTDAGGRFEEFYAIYESSLPSREQKNRAAIRDLIHRDDYRVLVLESEATVFAFSVVFFSRVYDFCLLEYMATRADQRNLGFGGAMLEASLAAAPGRPMLVEVELRARAQPRPGDQDQTQRLLPAARMSPDCRPRLHPAALWTRAAARNGSPGPSERTGRSHLQNRARRLADRDLYASLCADSRRPAHPNHVAALGRCG